MSGHQIISGTGFDGTATKQWGRLHEIVFSLNLAFAFAAPITRVLVGEADARFELSAHGAGGGSLGPFLRILFTLNRFLYPSPYVALGALTFDVLLTTLTLVLFTVLLLLLRPFLRADRSDGVLRIFGGITALAATPMSWLLAPLYHAPITFPGIWLLALYSALTGGALYLTRRKPNPLWLVILGLHYAVWTWFLFWYERVWPLDPIMSAFGWPLLLSLVGPCAGFVWVAYTIRPSGGERISSIVLPTEKRA